MDEMSKNEKNFSIRLRGYDKKEVDLYLARISSSSEERLKEQAERIDALRAENAELRAENDRLTAREKSVSSALLAAADKAEEIEAAAKVRYSLEIQRLKRFQEKWADYLDRIKGEAPLSAEVKRYGEFMAELEAELTSVMERDLNMSVEAGAEKYAEYLREKKEKKEEGFNLREALTPKQTLAEICRDLGLTD